ncbi:MAG: acetolactate synthase small subunit [Spirochaetes bacterium]|nr:acetolactate synthase small subunit [Spirochaetota bacterium]
MDRTVIQCIVRNNPGMLSHITGLFSRRGYNIEGIFCTSLVRGKWSRIFLLVAEDSRLQHILRQLEKLYDVIQVSLREDIGAAAFDTVCSVYFNDGKAAAPSPPPGEQ